MIKEFVAGKLHVMVYPDRNASGAAAAEAIAVEIKELLKGKEEVNIIFAAAISVGRGA